MSTRVAATARSVQPLPHRSAFWKFWDAHAGSTPAERSRGFRSMTFDK